MSLLRPRTWTLRTKLLASILALYLGVSALTGAATVLASRASLLSQVDDQLTAAARSAGGARGPRRPLPPPGIGTGQLTCALGDPRVGTEGGGAAADPAAAGAAAGSSCFVTGVDGTVTDLDPGEVARRVRAAGAGEQPRTVVIGGGSYRVVAAARPAGPRGTADHAGTVQVRGLPLEPVQETVARLARTLALVGLLGLGLIGMASWLLVRRNLAPLRRVAATARQVSLVPLATGPAGTGQRVQPRDTDPRTEVGQVGSALNGLLDHVDGALAARHASEQRVRQFVADASHELRTPLASIRGYAELSRREPQPVPGGVRHALGRIESEAGRMTTLVDDLLLLARLDSGRPLARAEVDLTRVVVETVDDARVAGPDHRWVLDLPDEPCELTGDEARLRQVLINLLANARAHTPAGTTVTTTLRSTVDRVELAVADDGPGVPPELAPHVFERFARGDASRSRTAGSTGLGLAIVQAVVAGHGGTVVLQSRPGRTVVQVSLPTAPPAPPAT